MNQSIESTLSILPSNKEQIKTFSALLLSEIDNGNAKPLEVLKTFKAFEKVFEDVKKGLMEKCLNEASKYGEKKFSACGITFETMEAGTKYDYSGCGDIKYNSLQKELKVVQEEIKIREAILKALKEPMDILDSNTGEVYRIHPPVKSSTTTLKTTF